MLRVFWMIVYIHAIIFPVSAAGGLMEQNSCTMKIHESALKTPTDLAGVKQLRMHTHLPRKLNLRKHQPSEGRRNLVR
jgi:hypothetical protein